MYFMITPTHNVQTLKVPLICNTLNHAVIVYTLFVYICLHCSFFIKNACKIYVLYSIMLLTGPLLFFIQLLSGINHFSYRVPVTAASGPELRHVTPGQEEVTVSPPEMINVTTGTKGEGSHVVESQIFCIFYFLFYF